jgi:hypothetical protein
MIALQPDENDRNEKHCMKGFYTTYKIYIYFTLPYTQIGL